MRVTKTKKKQGTVSMTGYAVVPWTKFEKHAESWTTADDVKCIQNNRECPLQKTRLYCWNATNETRTRSPCKSAKAATKFVQDVRTKEQRAVDALSSASYKAFAVAMGATAASTPGVGKGLGVVFPMTNPTMSPAEKDYFVRNMTPMGTIVPAAYGAALGLAAASAIVPQAAKVARGYSRKRGTGWWFEGKTTVPWQEFASVVPMGGKHGKIACEIADKWVCPTGTSARVCTSAESKLKATTPCLAPLEWVAARNGALGLSH